MTMVNAGFDFARQVGRRDAVAVARQRFEITYYYFQIQFSCFIDFNEKISISTTLFLDSY